MRRPRWYLLLLMGWLLSLDSSAAAERPNVILIFTDDQGYNDLGCFGSPNIQTPNIDRMATEGMRFTSFYSAASVCTPSRAALLTGCYPERVGNLSVLFPFSDRGLHPDETTIAEMLREYGYATACIGKWHLGHHPLFLPTNHGFDRYLGVPYSNDMGVDGLIPMSEQIVFREGRTAEDLLSGRLKRPPLMRDREIIEWPTDQTQLTKRYTAEAIRFIVDHAEQPFFLYLPHTMPHIPLYASDDFRGKSEAGLYGDTLEEIDWSVGEILKKLQELRIDENTIIIYTSDNGPWNLKGNATSKIRGNQNRSVGGSAYPLRGHKFSNWEGGMRVPCVMRWPGQIPAGKTCDETAGTIDLFPTIAALMGADTSTERPIDGKSMLPLIEGSPGAVTSHDAYFYRTAGVRSGKWKWINGKLFDLKADVSETTDVAAEYPDVVQALKARLEVHRAEMRQHGRQPAYFQRPMHSFAGLEGWTVVAGRWNLRKGHTLRQNSNWLISQLLSPRVSESPARLELEAHPVQGSVGFQVNLFADGDAGVSFRLGADGNTRHILRVSKDRAILGSTTIEGSIDSGTWYRVRLEVEDARIRGYLNDELVGEVVLSTPMEFRYISLGSIKSRVDFRGLKAFSVSGATLLATPPVTVP